MANAFESEEDLALEEELHEAGEAGEGEGIPGAIGNVLGGLLSEEDLQGEELGELHELRELGELHERGEVESGEQFFRRIARRIGGFVKRAAPILKRVAGLLPPWSCLQLAGRWAASWGNWPLRR